MENHSKFEIKSANYINENHTTNNTLNESDTHELEVMLRRTMFLRIITNNLRQMKPVLRMSVVTFIHIDFHRSPQKCNLQVSKPNLVGWTTMCSKKENRSDELPTLV
jgi:hypothetical protein